MNLSAIQRFAPLLGLLNKPVGQLADDDLRAAASAIAGDNPEPLFGLFRDLRSAEPETMVSNLLGSPSAQRVLESLKDRKESAENDVFCTCPNCGTSFETTLN